MARDEEPAQEEHGHSEIHMLVGIVYMYSAVTAASAM